MSEEIDIKVGTLEESLWTDEVPKAENNLKEAKKMVIFWEKYLEMARKELENASVSDS